MIIRPLPREGILSYLLCLDTKDELNYSVHDVLPSQVGEPS